MKAKKIIYLILFTVLILGSESYAQNSNDLCNLDKSKMIPLRDAKYRKYQYTANLEGSAIKKVSIAMARTYLMEFTLTQEAGLQVYLEMLLIGQT